MTSFVVNRLWRRSKTSGAGLWFGTLPPSEAGWLPTSESVPLRGNLSGCAQISAVVSATIGRAVRCLNAPAVILESSLSHQRMISGIVRVSY